MIIEDHIWEFFSIIYYFFKDFQTLLAAFVVVGGGWYAYKRERNALKKEKEKLEIAIALNIQTKIEEIFARYSGMAHGLSVVLEEHKKNIDRGMTHLVYLRQTLSNIIVADTFFQDRKNLVDLAYLTDDPYPVFHYFSVHETLRLFLSDTGTFYYKGKEKDLIPANDTKAKKNFLENYLNTFDTSFLLLQSSVENAIVALEVLSKATNKEFLKEKDFNDILELVKNTHKDLTEELSKITNKPTNN